MINFSGISSGLDTAAIIDATIQAQRVPIQRLQARRGGFEAQISAIGEIKGALNELKTMMEDMQDTSNVLSFTSKTSDEEVLTASIDGGASAGSYAIETTQLASAEKDRSVAFGTEFSTVKAGTITFETPGEDPVEVVVEEGDSIKNIVDKINASGARVDASLISDGTSTYMQVVASDSGHELGGLADDAIVITESYTGTEGTELGLTQIVAAQNALFTVDGLAVEHRSNSVTDVIQDVNLELLTTGSATLDIATDRDGTKEKVQGFVDKYNEVLDLIKNQTQTSDGARAIDTDPALLQIANELRGVITASVGGVNGSFNALSRIGIETSIDGSLTIDSTGFDDALNADIRGIGQLFTLADNGIGAKLESVIDKYVDGSDSVLSGRTTALNNRITGVDRQIVTMETRLEATTTRMRRQFTALEQTMSAINLQQGALGALLG